MVDTRFINDLADLAVLTRQVEYRKTLLDLRPQTAPRIYPEMSHQAGNACSAGQLLPLLHDLDIS
jgi:hypothetical protein